jgi:anti-anti-sigma factor
MSIAEPQSSTPLFEIETRPERSRIVVTPRGELDLATVGRLERSVGEVLARGFTAVLLDLRELAFIDSSGLRLLLRLEAAAARGGWSFAVNADSGPAARLLALTRMASRFNADTTTTA